jgi:hypothetical protein
MWLGGDLWRWDIIPFLIWVTFPFNLLIYGINDIFDQETDNINARKGGMEGAKISPSEVRPIFIGVAVTNIPFLIYFALTVPPAAMGWILAYALFFYFYSSPPFRFKARPVWDSVSNTDYAFPLVFIPLAFSNEPVWFAAIGLMIWSMATKEKLNVMNSTMGRKPFMAAPTEIPAKPSSAMGVSNTRFGPNSSNMPWVTLYAPLYSATSSPQMKMEESKRISSDMASRRASRNCISLIPVNAIVQGWFDPLRGQRYKKKVPKLFLPYL